MSNSCEEKIEHLWVVPGIPIWRPIRVVTRMTAGLSWTIGAFLVLMAATSLGLFFPALSHTLRKRIARRWVKMMPALLGLRKTVYGRVPDKPYFLVINHITWLDFLAMNSLCDVRPIIMAQMTTMPVVGSLFKAMDPIPTRRIKEDNPRVLAEIKEAILKGDSLIMAPEGNISPGRDVRRFRARFFGPAVDCQMPVHYASVTYRTPDNCPPAKERVLFGPDPDYPWPGGKIPESEYEGWGPRRSMLTHVILLLALPWYEIVVRFAPEPILGTDPVQLANDLHSAVESIFTPVH